MGELLPPFGQPHRLRRVWRGLLRRSEGSAAVEFAFIAPVFLVLLFGIFDIAQLLYAKSVLDGAVQSAARLSHLETGDTEEADTMVENSVKPIIPSVELQTSRVSYFDFADISRPETWGDDDDDGECNNGENYVDYNGNGEWDTITTGEDRDVGEDGNGGASDVVVYTVTATYSSSFKVPFTDWTDRTLTSTAVRKNQPFADQAPSPAGTCI
jgi:hypothetical protein